MAKCGCSSSCSCVLQGVDTQCIDTTVSGSGTAASPYRISSVPILDPAGGITCGPAGLSASGAFSGITTSDTNCIDLSGNGTGGSPLSADPIISAAAGNQISCTAGGLFVPTGAGVTSHTHDGTGGATSLVVGGLNEGGATVPTSTSLQSIAIGDFANAGTGTQPIAIGSGTNITSAPSATGQGAIAIGASNGAAIAGARASGANSVAIGSGDGTTPGASCTGGQGIAIGYNSSCAGQAVSIGQSSSVSGNQMLALGTWATCTTSSNTIAIGSGGDATRAPLASASAAIAIGSNPTAATLGARASGAQSIAIGGGTTAQAGASATSTASVAIGRTASATHANAVALGDGVATTNTSQVNIGTKRLFLGIPTTAPADADVINSQTSLWLDESTRDFFPTYKAKTSGGVVKTGGWDLGEWEPYVPVLTQGVVVTATVNHARWNRIGRTINVQVALTVTGSGTAANNVTVSIPVIANSIASLPAGVGFLIDSSAALSYKALVLLNTTTTIVLFPTNTTTNGFLGADTFVDGLAVGDVVYVEFSYEATT